MDETQGRLRSFENKSFEIPVNTKFDQEKEDLKGEVKKFKQECERLNKRIKQVENDLADSEQSFEKADERNCELEDQIMHVRHSSTFLLQSFSILVSGVNDFLAKTYISVCFSLEKSEETLRGMIKLYMV